MVVVFFMEASGPVGPRDDWAGLLSAEAEQGIE
jgi:hypothetical protein